MTVMSARRFPKDDDFPEDRTGWVLGLTRKDLRHLEAGGSLVLKHASDLGVEAGAIVIVAGNDVRDIRPKIRKIVGDNKIVTAKREHAR